MKVKLLRTPDVGLYREAVLKIGERKLELPLKAIEHKSGIKNSPCKIGEERGKISKKFVIEYRVHITPERLHKYLNEDRKVIYEIFKDLSLLENHTTIVTPYFVTKEVREISESEIEGLASIYAAFLKNHRFRNNILMIPALIQCKGKKFSPEIFENYISVFLKKLKEGYDVKNPDLIGYVFNAIPLERLRKIIVQYLTHEVLHYAIDLSGGTPFSQYNMTFIQDLLYLLRSIEKELEENIYLHFLNLNARGKKEIFEAKDFLSVFVSAYTFSSDMLPRGGFPGGRQEEYKRFDRREYVYRRMKNGEVRENEIKLENSLAMNRELFELRKLDEKEIVKHVKEKMGYKQVSKEIERIKTNVKQKRIM